MKKATVTTFLLLLFFLGFAQSQLPADALYTAFKQGKRGNCASVALIKAAIRVFGIDGIFKEKAIEGRSVITLKNGDTLTITSDEIAEARQSADFILLDSSQTSLLNYAVKCYAVMGKMRERIESLDSYRQALNKLEDGAYTPTVYEYLGLERNKKTFPKMSNVNDLCGVVAWRKKHAVYACNGYMDEHGKKKNLTLRYYGRFQILP